MGKTTGFLEYERKSNNTVQAEERVRNFEDFHQQLDAAERRKQAARCMNCGVPFCQAGMEIAGKASGCPLHNLIPEWNDEIYRDNPDQALARLLKTNNFPEFTGRVCPAFCEASCVNGLYTSPVTVRDNELSVIETGFAQELIKPELPEIRSGKRIAVIGSGPAGLAAADCLNRRGHSVTVFEKNQEPGGLLMYGIPNMKLDKSVIRRRIDLLKAEGISFITGTDVRGDTYPAAGKYTAVIDCNTDTCSAAAPESCGVCADTNANAGVSTDASAVMADYDAVILCCGAGEPRRFSCRCTITPYKEAECKEAAEACENTADCTELKGVRYAVDYLSDVTRRLIGEGCGSAPGSCDSYSGDSNADAFRDDYTCAAGKHVVIVGAGDTGNDCVASVVREGCASVVQLVRKSREAIMSGEESWPFMSKGLKTDYGQEEAIAVFGSDPRMFGTSVAEVISSDGESVSAVKLRKPDGSEEIIPCDLLLLATGFSGCELYTAEAFGAALDAHGNIASEEADIYHVHDNVFTAGDARRGASLVVYAIAEGRACAKAVDEYLMGYSLM